MRMSNIIYILLFCSLSTISAQSDDLTLMTIGDQEVSVGEFRYIYEKNNGDGADYSEASVKEYLDLYTRFKLKVAEARSMGLDTITELNNELDGYRKQLADSYIMDKEVLKSLTKELYDRKQKDVKLSHILVSVSKRANEKEVEKKRLEIENIYSKLKSGEDFSQLAKTYSQDKNTAKSGGDFGWLTAKLPNGFYDFENAMYQLEIGELSEIIRTPLGFHIMKITERRPARGRIRVAHILKRSSTSNPLEAKKAIDKIFVELSAGADFSELAKKESEDQKTANNGGELQPFGIKVFESSFEDAAFGLDRVGKFSRPVKTKIGWHIIQLIEKIELEPYEEYEAKTLNSLKKDERYEKQKDLVVSQIQEKAGFNYNQAVIDKYANSLDTDFYTYKWKPKAVADEVVFAFTDKDYKLSDFVSWLKSNTRLRLRFDKSDPINTSVNSLFDEFAREATLKYEQSNLEKRHPEYKSLMREYEEGILLFEASKREVWDKASQDTLGLYSFYDQNKTDYMWLPRAELAQYTIKSIDPKKTQNIYDCAKKKNNEKLLKKFNKKEEVLYVDIKKVERGSKNLGEIEWKEGARSTLVLDAKAATSKFNKILKIHEPAIKTIEEARGYVIADYQDQLEKQWVEDLRKKYNVSLNQEVVNQLIK